MNIISRTWFPDILFVREENSAGKRAQARASQEGMILIPISMTKEDGSTQSSLANIGSLNGSNSLSNHQVKNMSYIENAYSNQGDDNNNSINEN